MTDTDEIAARLRRGLAAAEARDAETTIRLSDLRALLDERERQAAEIERMKKQEDQMFNEDTKMRALIASDAEIEKQKARAETSEASLREAVEVLRSIEVYGSDTMSRPSEAIGGRLWYLEGVRVMRDRARDFLAKMETKS